MRRRVSIALSVAGVQGGHRGRAYLGLVMSALTFMFAAHDFGLLLVALVIPASGLAGCGWVMYQRWVMARAG
jgi:hypothetical protein